MNDDTVARPSKRLVSLDVFRGITIAGMILVNNPGSWGNIYKPLGHAKWNGWTPTDLIFPFFLFIVGVALTYSFDKRLAQGQSRIRLFEQVVRRTVILFLLGVILAGFPNWRLIGPYLLVIVGMGFLFAHEPPLSLGKTAKERGAKTVAWVLLVGAVLYFALDFGYFQQSKIRIPGVLQRIALCYFVTSIIVMYAGVRGRALWAVGLASAYWIIYKGVSAPEGVALPVERAAARLNEWIDLKIFGQHLYSERPDPEGLLSTLPSISTTLIGVLTGNWLHTKRDNLQKVTGLFFMGNLLLVLGLCLNPGFPINKKIWSTAYVVFTGGMALHFLAMCYWLIDVKGFKRWAAPFLAYGTNPILVFFASGILGRLFYRIKVGGGDIALKTWLYQNLFASWAEPKNASLAYALTYIVFWLLLLIPLYRKRIFIKI